MYTIDDNNRDEFDDEVYENKSWNNGTGLIIKIIIIILCVVILIWLVNALKNNSGKKDTGLTHDENVLKVRLAAEEYFFLKNNKETESHVSLKKLESNGLVDKVVDANGKVCSDNSKVTLKKGDTSYKMTVILDCSTNDDEEIFYYHLSNLACQNCNGKTLMTGQSNVPDKKDEEKEEENEGENNNDDNYIPDDNGEQGEYSCVTWSDWQTDRITDSTLEERTKTLVQGVKYGKTNINIQFSDWSDFTTTPIEASEKTEVETKVETTESWGETKTAYSVDTSNPNIRIIGKNTETISSSCPSGYTLNGNRCISKSESVGNLTYSEFNSGRYKINNGLCAGVKNIRNSSGKYEITYLNCRYNRITNAGNYSSSSRTLYTYQERILNNITYYRFRTKQAVQTKEEDVYTNQKYEEKDLPEGFVKVPGTEEVFYSYKYEVCVK